METTVTDKLTGKNGYIRVSDDVQNRVKIPFTSWVATSTISFADRTSTRNYSKQTKLVYRSSAPIVHSLTAEAKGLYRKSLTPSTVIAQLFRGTVTWRVELGFSPIYPYADFYAWIENLEMAVGAEDTVSFSCTLRSEGEITDLTDFGNFFNDDE